MTCGLERDDSPEVIPGFPRVSTAFGAKPEAPARGADSPVREVKFGRSGIPPPARTADGVEEMPVREENRSGRTSARTGVGCPPALSTEAGR